MRRFMLRLLAPALLGLSIPVSASAAAPFILHAADFTYGGPIPAIHEGVAGGCTGKNVEITLRWSGAPVAARSFALLEYDPDLPKQYRKMFPHGFIHWVAYNIPAAATTLGPGLPMGYSNGTNGAGKLGFLGPCPPAHGPAHHYHFNLYALNVAHLPGKALTRDGLLAAIKGHVITTATLIGTYRRP